MKLIKNLDINLKQPEIYYEGCADRLGIFQNCVHIIGFEFDGTACFRKGTKDGPNALRAVSDGIETYSPYLDLDIEDHLFVDLGNLDLEQGWSSSFDVSLNTGGDNASESDNKQAKLAELQWQSGTDSFVNLFANVDIKQDKVRILTLGGEHSISYAPITTYLKHYPDLCVLHLDAHADLRDGYLGFHYSHASIIRRVLDHFGSGHELIQYGIRSGTADEYQWMRQNQTLVTDRQSFLEKVAAIPDDRPIYLTFDLDYFDPSFFPGTGTPEPGGEDFHSFVSLCKILRNKNFVGCDVVELSPTIDATGNSDVFATKVVRELILCLSENV